MKKSYLIILCLFFGIGMAHANVYPRYMGVDCSAEGHKGLAFNYVDEYCAHIVCEEPGFCIPYGYYVYAIPVLDYRGAHLVADASNSPLLLRGDGGAISWGNHTGMLEDREDIRQQLKSGVREVHASDHALAVLKNNGSVITWTDGANYGEIDSEKFVSNIAKDLAFGAFKIFSGSAGFVALTKNDSVVSWHGGIDKKNKPKKGYKVPGLLAREVADVQMNIGALGVWHQNGVQGQSHRSWAALKKDGSVVVWGDENSGGKIGTSRTGLENVVKLYSTWSAFAALKSDGSVSVWGSYEEGGDLSFPWSSQGQPLAAHNELQSGVTGIYATDSAFAALKSDGTVVTWGNPVRGGDPGVVSGLLQNVVEIVSTTSGFAALTGDGTVISWGDGLQDPYPAAPIHTDVKKLIANTVDSFVALKNDGSVVAWGNSITGGDISPIALELESGVQDIYASYASFAAIKEDGSVLSWGDEIGGIYTQMQDMGHLSAKSETDPKRITHLFSSSRRNGFFAVRNDGSAISWGAIAYPYHASFYDILDDPIWSRILPDMDYVRYFSLEPLKRRQSLKR